MTKNQIEYQKHLETVRSNKARETETARSNKRNEDISSFVARSNDYWRGREYDTTTRYQLGSLAETQRSNLAREQETNRANLAKEAENYRSNLARETETARHNLASEQADLMRAQAAQTQASASVMQVNLGYAQLAETTRANQARESAILQSQAETARSNAARERLQAEAQAETRRSNLANIDLGQQKVSEQYRHNVVSEGQEYIALGIQQKDAESRATQATAAQKSADAAKQRAESGAFRDYATGISSLVGSAFDVASSAATSIILGG